MAEQLSKSKHSALRWWIHGGVSRVLQHMERVEKDPHGVRRVREPAMNKGVCRQQVAEFVVGGRLGQRHYQEKREP